MIRQGNCYTILINLIVGRHAQDANLYLKWLILEGGFLRILGRSTATHLVFFVERILLENL